MKNILRLCAALAFLVCAVPAGAQTTSTRTAIFAGGCFWSMQHALESIPGVVSTEAGFSGGSVANPSYEQVSEGGTGHRESVRVTYDPAKVDYDRILAVYWRNIDPFDADGQFCDKGEQYHAAIFTADDEEKQTAEVSKEAIAKRFGKPVATDILPAAPFYPAEDYHQHYADKNPVRYGLYRTGCGRDAAMKAIWGDEAGGGKTAR
jgi:peptide-methionine (S)-S-oxide reductase